MKLSHKLIILLIVIIILVTMSFKVLNNTVAPVLMRYAKEETVRLATLVINDAISRKVVEELTLDNLFLITEDNNGEVISIDFNSIVVNKVLTITTSAAEANLRKVMAGKIEELGLSDSISVDYEKEREGIFYMIPMGVVLKNSLLSNLGPRVPVKMSLVGSITSGVETKVTNYGINNALIEVYVHISVNIQVILPFSSERITVDTDIPVAIKLIRGSIPQYYANGNLSSPLLSIPLE